MRRWPVRLFRVEDDSMRPTLSPGDGLVGVRGRTPRRGELRVFRHPHRSTLWLVKRVGDVLPSSSGAVFEALSDDPVAAGAGDSRSFGPVAAAGSYRVLWTVRAPAH